MPQVYLHSHCCFKENKGPFPPPTSSKENLGVWYLEGSLSLGGFFKRPRGLSHPWWLFCVGTRGAHPGCTSLQHREAGGLPQAPGQLASLLHQHIRGDDRQVESQQLVALDGLSRVSLAIVAQELPRERGNRTQE